KVGEQFDETKSSQAIRALYKTGFFKDVRIEREGDVLVVSVDERPSIAEIEIIGNKEIDEEPLREALKQIGLVEGAVFDRSILDRVEQELERQYFARGKYSVRIDTTRTPLSRNRVGLRIDISEGSVARIKRIDLIGVNAFDPDDLLDLMELGLPPWYSFFSDADKYSKPKLTGDLEAIRSYYLDRGYMKFDVRSTQVSITPDKQDIFVTVNVDEGDVYTVKEIKLAGDLVLPEDRLFDLVKVIQGEPFSRRDVVGTTEAIGDRLGDEGYAFANVNAIPDVDEEGKTVTLTFFVDPGKRVYVRRINMRGNTKTRDEVLRREMRQMEASWYEGQSVKRSKERLQQLGYFQTVDMETEPVPGTGDQMDITYRVAELPSGNLLAGIGFSQSQGIVFNASISQENFLGTGKRFSASVNTSDVNTTYTFSFNDPYYTIDGVSRGFTLRYKETDASNANVSDYTFDTLEGSVRFGLPLNEYDEISTTLTASAIDVTPGATASNEVRNFLATEGDSYLLGTAGLGWSRDTRNNAVFATKGTYQRIGTDVVVPGSDLTFYTLSYRNKTLFELPRRMVLSLRGDVAYGDGYGDSSGLPFFRHFYAGGVSSVRGFKSNTIGPRDSSGDPFGGSFRTVGNIELIFPSPFKDTADTLRPALFYDIGSVYDSIDDWEADDLRSSVGVALKWFTPVGPISFSLAEALNTKDGDNEQRFQFTLGVDF
ncbi:MAG: outer membrane protein assembly factor BamA, partial [Gammaproteobacteria bacterium]